MIDTYPGLTHTSTVSDSFRIEKEYDADGISDINDNCPYHSNPEQENLDTDSSGDACDEDVDGDDLDNDSDMDDDNDGLSDVFWSGGTATIDQHISTTVQCAPPMKVIIDTNTDVLNSGMLRIVTPESEFKPGFGIRNGGEISVHSEMLP